MAETAARATGVDSEVARDFKTLLEEKSRQHEETLPIVQRLSRAGQRFKSANKELDKRIATHTALEAELADVHTRLAVAHEAMWESRQHVATLEDEVAALEARVPPPPPPVESAAAAAASTTSRAGGSIEDILLTARGASKASSPPSALVHS